MSGARSKKQPPFYLGGVASMGACVISNPFEVVKIRMQLQGELQTSGSYQRQYKNVPQAFITIIRDEGFRGVQAGLGAGLGYQAVMNGTRLGAYPLIKQALEGWDTEGKYTIPCRVLGGATSGCLGACVGSPFYLAKIRLQAHSHGSIHVGTQYDYKNTLDCFRKIVAEDGIRGLWRGVDSAITRVAVGSAVQLSTYDTCKAWVVRNGLAPDNIYAHVLSSMLASILVACCMNPFDVVSTRMYNQPVVDHHGALYKSVPDCLYKIVRLEGFLSLWKGLGAHYLRLGPHTVLTFVFWEQLQAAFRRMQVDEEKPVYRRFAT